MKKAVRIIVRHENEYIALPVADIVVVEKIDNHLLVTDKYSNEYRHNCGISELMQSLDNRIFFQANRKQIINIHYIRGFRIFEKVKLMVTFHFMHKDRRVIISQQTAPTFKKWITEEVLS